MDGITNKNNKDDDKNWQGRMLIIEPSGSGKTNVLFNLIQKQNNDIPIGKIYLYAKDLSEPKYEFLIEKCVNAGIRKLNDQVHLLNILTPWMMFATTLIITIQKENKKV